MPWYHPQCNIDSRIPSLEWLSSLELAVGLVIVEVVLHTPPVISAVHEHPVLDQCSGQEGRRYRPDAMGPLRRF